MSKIERIAVDRQAARLPKDLEKYCHKALELEATQAKIIPVQEIVVDDPGLPWRQWASTSTR